MFADLREKLVQYESQALSQVLRKHFQSLPLISSY